MKILYVGGQKSGKSRLAEQKILEIATVAVLGSIPGSKTVLNCGKIGLDSFIV